MLLYPEVPKEELIRAPRTDFSQPKRRTSAGYEDAILNPLVRRKPGESSEVEEPSKQLEDAKEYIRQDKVNLMLKDQMEKNINSKLHHSRFVSLESATRKLERIEQVLHADIRTSYFVRRYLKQKNQGKSISKAYELISDEKYMIRLNDLYNRRVDFDEMLKNKKRLKEEKEAMEILAGKKMEIEVTLSPAKKLQKVIFDHRHVAWPCNSRI